MAIATEYPKASFLRAAIISGLVAGAAFLTVEMSLIAIFSKVDAWLPVRIIASIAIGKDVLLSALLYNLNTTGMEIAYNIAVLTIALILHFAMSIVYSFVIGGLCMVRNLGVALGIGAVIGLIIYLINFYGFTTIYPWFEKGRNIISLFAHILFGIVAAYSFVKIRYPITRETTAGPQIT